MSETHIKERVFENVLIEFDNVLFEMNLSYLKNAKIYKNNIRIIIFIEILYWFEHISLRNNNISKYYLI